MTNAERLAYQFTMFELYCSWIFNEQSKERSLKVWGSTWQQNQDDVEWAISYRVEQRIIHACNQVPSGEFLPPVPTRPEPITVDEMCALYESRTA